MDSSKITVILGTFIVSIVGFVLLPTYVSFVGTAATSLTAANLTAASTLVNVTPIFYVLMLLGLPIGGVYMAFRA